MKRWRNSLAGFLMALMLGGCALGISEIPLADLEQRYATGASRFIEIDGLRVHYRVEGTGQPIVLLHGILASLHNWEGWSRELKSEYRVISLDLPGHGLTGPKSGFNYNREDYIDFIEQFVAALELKEFTLIGNSLGGYFAWNYAIDHPEQVKRLVLIDSGGFPLSRLPLPIRVFTAPLIGEISMHFTPRFAASMLLRQVYADPSRISEAMIERYYELQLRPGNRRASRALFHDIKKHAFEEPKGLEKLSMPVLLMWGEQDTWIPSDPHLSKWRQALPEAAVVTYPDAGHMAMEEIPEQSVKDLQHFLAAEPLP